MEIPADILARFAADLDALTSKDDRIGVAVSGGPDSLALLLLAAAARSGRIEAATVDHGLRAESADEAAMVAALCARLNVPHRILPADWSEPPTANIQAEARTMRYRLLADWARERGLGVIVTAHHADDQAETLLMRLARGSGVRGLAGVRPRRALAQDVQLARPLLGWRKDELVAVIEAAGVKAVEDPSNKDPSFDRARVRGLLGETGWLDPARLSAAAEALREADEAIDWALAPLIPARVSVRDGRATVDPSGLPRELRRRLLLAAFAELGTPAPRGPELDRAMDALERRQTVTLADLKLEGGNAWHLSPAPPRRG